MTQVEWRDMFANNLVDILRDRRMSQSQLSQDSGLSMSRISDYINKRATPTIFAIINMAYALDMDICELVDFDDRIN